ncbi:hypothetical protein MYX84_04445 [Acidobacteria bacterium AH-259-O06]|nr:hypothetical protein [Acidobacteria bacterium AH-259-O06]
MSGFRAEVARKVPPEQNQFLGTWRIIETELWDSEALDLLGPAHITFEDNEFGELQLIAIEGGIDYRVSTRTLTSVWWAEWTPLFHPPYISQ